jgi:O-antigen biosynthesis protein
VYRLQIKGGPRRAVPPLDLVRARLGSTLLIVYRAMDLSLRTVGLGAFVRRSQAWAIRRTGLFDEHYYLEQHRDVAEAGLDAIHHYVRFGDREGRSPIPLFDPGYYRANASGRARHLNALLHYVLVGRYMRYPPSPWFDVVHYLRQNDDVRRAGTEPLRHYLRYGGSEGRSPCPEFDGVHYLRANPDVVAARVNPLIHFLTIGRIEGRSIRPEPGEDPGPVAALPTVPAWDDWTALEKRGDVQAAGIDVIVPVYRGRVETLGCLFSVLKSRTGKAFELVVIDDASPEPELRDDIERLALSGHVRLVSNLENQGFVQAVNRGIALHPARDVVILNSDTEVYDGWLDRLCAAAAGHRRVATVTPLSNNATICSYPRFLQDNPYPLEIDYADLDALIARLNRGRTVEVPTGVGFCMLMTRASIDQLGAFDAKLFGRGYGEENDFCQRAIKRGWRNLVAADVFVRHWGGTSFQGQKAKLEQQAIKRVVQRHPRYLVEVRQFIETDPLREARRVIDMARLTRLRREKGNVLMVNHNRGGGTERHVSEDTAALLAAGFGVFILRPVLGDPSRVRLSSPLVRNTPNIPFFRLEDPGPLTSALRAIGITEIHSHSLVDMTPAAPAHLQRLVTELGARWEINLHDYKVVCPRINLADEHGLYCGEPADAECNKCLRNRGSDFDVADIRWWRSMHLEVLQAADAVTVPDQDAAVRLERYFPGLSIDVSPHDRPDTRRDDVRPVVRREGKPLHVVVVGAISKLKGYHVLARCARDASDRKLPLRFTVLGYTQNDFALRRLGVDITGQYRDDDVVALLNELDPDLVWLPSTWPETYSYTLSAALKTDLPIAAFDIGAIATRLRAIGESALLMPLSWSGDARRINARLLVSGTPARPREAVVDGVWGG